ncbi:MAG TPA: preprotein translocase subunit SecY [Firmicutes bacterium]|nr:preprotein translocase subunit SecY [Bacillota bacterium]
MFEAVRNVWKIADLRKKILFTLAMFLVFRVGAHITVPGLDAEAVQQLFSQGLFGFVDLISGGALAKLSIFALSIGPYITSSIIVNLLMVIIPSWENLAKEGEEGRKKIEKYTRYGTVILAFAQGFATSWGLRNTGAVLNTSIGSLLLISLSFTAGTAVLMWIGDLITSKGIGNGISLIILANIVSRVPSGLVSLYMAVKAGTLNIFALIILAILGLVVVAGVIIVQEGQRRIPVQYAKRVVGRKMYGGQSTHIPLRVNQAGVIPVIFASSLLMLPQMLTQFIDKPWAKKIAEWFAFGSPLHIILYIAFIIMFAYFYTFMQFNPRDISDNLKKSGGFIPGLRPGKPTADYLYKVVNRLTLVGALFLSVIVLLPLVLSSVFKYNIGLGGNALLIIVGVALETMKEIEAQMAVRHYGGFMR